MSSSRKVAVTGMGLATPLGAGVEATWKGVLAGSTGISRHDGRDGGPECLKYFGTVTGLDRLENIPSNLTGQVRFLNRGSRLGFEAAREAISHSRLDLPSIPKERRALYIASGDLTSVGYEFMHPALKEVTREDLGRIDLRALNRSTVNRVNPFFLLESICNNLFSFLSAAFEFMGPNTSLASMSPCGANTLELACRAIRTGEADAALAVGCGNWITEIPMYEMDGLGILSKCRRGVASFRPLDRGRDGFVPGEGGAAILLEDEEAAEKRGAAIFARINGLGNCIEFPPGRGLSVPERISKKSIESALAEGSVDARDLAFICPHGSGTRKGDRSELHSIAEVLGGDRGSVPICALKPYTGHMGAASDICEVILGIRAISEGIAPGTPNFSMAEPGFEDLRISASTRKTHGKSFLSVSYGILGQSSSVLVEAA
ncbi:MAG: beta-ketoacyl synthase N-terminal-like domain-containing protein [Syntrophobacteraceae bacterium]